MEQTAAYQIVEPPITDHVELEAMQPRTLAEEYGNTVVTLYGLTDTLNALSDLCPVPPEKRSSEATERFMARALIMDGHTLADYHIQRLGLQELVAVAQTASKPEPTEKLTGRTADEEPIGKPRPKETNPIEIKSQVIPRLDRQEEAHPIPAVAPKVPDILPLAELYLTDVSGDESQQHAKAMSRVETPADRLPKSVRMIQKTEVKPEAALLRTEAIVLPEPAWQSMVEAPVHVSPDVKLEPVQEGVEVTTGPEGSTPDISFAVTLFDKELGHEKAVAAGEAATDNGRQALEAYANQYEWTLEVAGRTPQDACEAFTDAIAAALEASSEQLASPYEAQAQADKSLQPAPAICAELHTRLVSLNATEKETAVPLAASVAEAVQEVRLIAVSGAAADEVAVAKERLRGLVVELLDALDITYGSKEVAQCMSFLLQEAFMPAPQPSLIDVEHRGTHEVKRRFPQFVLSLAGITSYSVLALGTFVLSRVYPAWGDVTSVQWYNKANA